MRASSEFLDSFFDSKSSFENRISDVGCLFEARQRTRADENLVERQWMRMTVNDFLTILESNTRKSTLAGGALGHWSPFSKYLQINRVRRGRNRTKTCLVVIDFKFHLIVQLHEKCLWFVFTLECFPTLGGYDFKKSGNPPTYASSKSLHD